MVMVEKWHGVNEIGWMGRKTHVTNRQIMGSGTSSTIYKH